LANFGVVFPP